MIVRVIRSLNRRLSGTRVAAVLVSFAFLSVYGCFLHAQENPQERASENTPQETSESKDDGVTEEEKQERLVADRFLELLTKRPRFGTALDKVYSYHIQRGTLDKFCEELRTEATEKTRGESWMLLGLVQQQRGRDAEALASLQKADELLPNDAMASYYLGKSLTQIGNSDLAVATFDQALQRKPAKAEMLVILQDLGRLYQRMGRSKDATDVWKNLEVSFPGDSGVKEEIASILAEEGATAEALVRYEELAATTKDRFRKIELSLWAAQLKEALGRRDDALADFERLLGQVNPDSWMYQDLRSRIDRTFTSRNDYDGLANYYQRWIETHPDDIDAMLRIGRLLSIQKRTPEAKQWFSKATERSPSNPAPRLALVDSFERDREFKSAAEAMRALVDIDPDNVDYIVRMGSLIFADQEVPEAERARAAADVWNKLLEKRADDPLTISRVADLLRGAKLVDEAIAAYRNAIALAENEHQYREYLGEYLFGLDRKEEALTVWRELASGPRENRDNLVRLSEVLATFKQDEEALATMARACSQNPTFDQRIRFAKMLRRASKFDDALAQLNLAEPIAESADERALLIDQQIETYQANGQLQAKTAELETLVKGAAVDDPVTWQKLALYQEADRKFHQAVQSIGHATELLPQSSLVLSIEARVREKAGFYAESIESLRKLAAIDRRFMSNYLMQIASLQMRIGRFKAAVATGQELVSSASANSEHFKFFGELCFQAGEDALGLDALRRNVRRNPNDRDAIRSLASKLSVGGDAAEAIELYWRSYAAADSIEDKRNDVLALTSLYQRTNQFEQLTKRLTAQGRELGNERETTLLVAAAHQATGDLRSARTLLESLLTDESRDVDLLNTLIQLAAAEFDWEAAVGYQRRLNISAPSPEGESRLAKFLIEKGELDEPIAIWDRLNHGKPTAERIAQVVDLLVNHRRNDKAVAFAQQALERDPDNWEVMSEVMLAMWRAENTDRAIEVAERLLKVKLPFDTPAAKRQNSLASVQTAMNASGVALPANSHLYDLSSRSAWLDRFSSNYQALMFANARGPIPSRPANVLSFGDARLMAMFLKLNGSSITRGPNGQIRVGGAAFQRRGSDSQEVRLTENQTAEDIWELLAEHYCVRISIGNLTENAPAIDALLNRLVEFGDPEAPSLLFESKYYARNFSEMRAGSRSISRMIRTRNFWLYSAISRLAYGRVQPTGQKTDAQVPNPLSHEELQKLVLMFEQTVAKTQPASEQIYYLLWFAKESVEREESAVQFLDRAKALAEQNLSTEILSEFVPFDRKFAIEKFVDCFKQLGQPQLGRANVQVTSYSAAMFLAELADQCKEPDEIASFLASLKDVQVANALTLRPSQLSNYEPNRKSTLFTFTRSRGQISGQNASITLPSPSALQSLAQLTCVYSLQKSAKAEIKEAVRKRFEEEAEAPDEEVLKNAVDRLWYATWLWWDGKKEDAIRQMTEFRKLGVANELATTIACEMLVDSHKPEEAIQLLDSFNPTTSRLLEYRELTMMTLALKNGQTDRAKKAVEQLYAMPLSAANQLRVSAAMDQLGMHDMSGAILQRLRRGGANDLASMSQLMTKLSSSETQSDKAAALELAWKIYQRTQPPSQIATQGRQPAGQVGGSGNRTNAIRLLVESGDTAKLIKSLEERLARAPKNEPLVHQLAELYNETGKPLEAAKILSPYMPETNNVTAQSFSSAQSVRRTFSPVQPAKETEEQLLAKEVKTRVVLLNGQLFSKEITDWDAVTKHLKRDLFLMRTESSAMLADSRVANEILGTESIAWRSPKGKLQEWLERVSATTEGKEKLKVLAKELINDGNNTPTLPQLSILACIASAAEDKDAALTIAKLMIAHPNATSLITVLSSTGRNTSWAAVPVAVKFGDADLAIQLAKIAMKPAEDTSIEAQRLLFELTKLQFEVDRPSSANATLRDITLKLALPLDKDHQERSDLAMKVAKLAAEKNILEVSYEATLQASLLGTTGSQKTNDDIQKLVHEWQEKQARPDRVYQTLKEIVFRGGDPNRWRLYPDPKLEYGGSHDFTFPRTDSKPLAFVLVDLATANNSLPDLAKHLDMYATLPALRAASLTMKAYAERTLGKASEAAKLIEEAIESSQSVPEEVLLLYALTTPVPNGDETTVVPKTIAEALLKNFLMDRVMHIGTRHAILLQIKGCIAANDRAMLDCYVSAVADAIPKVKNYDSQSLKLMLSLFYQSLANECTAQGRTELAAEYVQRAEAK